MGRSNGSIPRGFRYRETTPARRTSLRWGFGWHASSEGGLRLAGQLLRKGLTVRAPAIQCAL